MRTLIFRRRPKTFRSYGINMISKVRSASNRMYKNISKGINKLEMDDVLENARERVKTLTKQSRRLMQANRKRITRASWYRQMKKGTFFPKRYKRIKRSLNANYVQARGWVRAQVPRIKNYASRSTSNVADFATSTYTRVESLFSTRKPTLQRWVANAF